MGCQSISEFPIELHTIILTYLSAAYRLKQVHESLEPEFSLRRKIYDPNCSLPWDISSPSLFPYNVVSVCKLWRDILIRIPKAWTRLVFDVAQPPTPFLNAFLWSKDLIGLEIVMFNSADSAKSVDKARERRHVLAIQQAFLPHVTRYESIIYSFSFSSSLPAPEAFFCQPMPYLKELRLDCKQDDLDPIMPLGRRQPFAVSFATLEMLSLTGFWFMNVVRHAGEQWITELGLYDIATLRISNFKFTDVGIYSFDTFMDYISQMSYKFTKLCLHDLALSFPHRDPTSHFPGHSFGSSIQFQSVSWDFLARFNLLCQYEVVIDDLSFENCEIPIMYNFSTAVSLTLRGVKDSDNGVMIQNAISFGGTQIWIFDCPSFDDDTLRWMVSSAWAGMSNTTQEENIFESWFFPAPSLTSLSIESCGCISPRAVAEFIQKRPGCYITVEGPELPRLTEDDKILFHQVDPARGAIYWSVIEDVDGRYSWPPRETRAS